MSESLHTTLQRLADECARDDARATKVPWIWTDIIYLWNEEIDHGVLEHGGVEWPMSADDREVIAASRNRLPELARVLKESARQIDLLANLATQDSAARNRLRDEIALLERDCAGRSARVVELEKALERTLSTWCPNDPGGDGADGETYRMARAVLAKKEPSP